MRLALAAVIAGLVALPSVALACPPIEACLVNLKSTTKLEPARTTPPDAVTIDLHLPVLAPPRRAPGDVEVPWIWRVLRERVYDQMPTYQKNRNELKVVLAPVVVTSPSDTVPGLGIAGNF